jgi:ABC-2 type transport system ATP-binding protein
MNNLIDLKSVSKNYYLTKETTGIKEWCKQLLSPNKVEFQALTSIDLEIKEGVAVGFIGPNGAGKSSLIKILCGIQKPSSGTASVLGFNPSLREKEFLSQIGVVFGHKTSLWWDLPVKTSLETYKGIYNIKDSDFRCRLTELTEALNLSNVIHKPVRNLSLGERVKCELTLNLLHAPKLIFLDEPTVGLDVTSKHEIRKYLNYKRTNEGLSVFLTSHDLGDIESCCDNAVIIDKGEIRFDGSLIQLSENFKKNVKLTITHKDSSLCGAKSGELKKFINKTPGARIINDIPNQVTYLVPKNTLSVIFNTFQNDTFDIEVTPLDFENNVINLFKTWNRE